MIVTNLRRIFEYDSKEKQLNVVHTLRVKKQDVMLITKTKYEKSMIFHFISLFKFNSIILMIMSLNAFEKDQVSIIEKFENVNNLICDRFCVYNSKTSSFRLLKKIKKKCYIHVLINSKMIIQNAIFKKMLQDSSFQERLNLIIVDEIHLIFQWFEWRKTYECLEEFRSIVFRFIFFFVISTTLITFMINELIDSLRLNNSKIIREFIDKENIFINVYFI